METLRGRVINPGAVTGQAVVLRAPLSFITDFDIERGCIRNRSAETLVQRILVCPGGKGGTCDPYVAYEAKKRGVAPLAILCQEADPILALCAIVMDIPMLDEFTVNIVEYVKSEVRVIIENDLVTIEG